ncbi:MAG: hypothetical protein KBF37_04985 [Saprospiraceae bacterium]|jgi:hypothetical protein|nr:hypothetical protein [Saprospiraceae bacterium]MBP9209663.1 hypothetical protein [Saprospiraceae bacterium]MBV6471976.1 hypothetical protein [Saprospiraceae bacterium]
MIRRCTLLVLLFSCRTTEQVSFTAGELEAYKMISSEVFYLNEHLSAQSSYYRDSAIKLALVDLLAKYQLDTLTFHEITQMYYTNQKQYEQLLKDIQSMSDSKRVPFLNK